MEDIRGLRLQEAGQLLVAYLRAMERVSYETCIASLPSLESAAVLRAGGMVIKEILSLFEEPEEPEEEVSDAES